MLDGPRGGCSAIKVSLDEIADNEDFIPTPAMTHHHVEARNWIARLRKMMKMKLRKGVQPDDVPVEILRIVLRCRTRKLEKAGIGWDTEREARPARDFEERLEFLIAHAIASERFPWQLHSTWAWAIDKNNGKKGCAAMRLVHGVLSLAKALLAIAWEETKLRETMPPPDFVYHVTGRRREEAIAVQLIGAVRVAQRGKCILRNFRDTANAYRSIDHPCVLDALEKSESEVAYGMLEDHVLRGVFTLGSADEPESYRPDSGVLPGSSVGTALFNITAWPAQANWIQQRNSMGVADDFNSWYPEVARQDGETDEKALINVAATVFADDCGATTAGNSFEEVYYNDSVDDKLFNSTMKEIGLTQNASKAVRQL